MSQEHVFDRYTREKTATEHAEADATLLIQGFQNYAAMLRDWKHVGFAGKLPSGVEIDSPGAAKLIRFHEVPSMHAIYEAVHKWHGCQSEVKATVARMTEEQRRTLGLSQD